MNRAKKEEMKKRSAARKGLSPEQIKKLDADEVKNEAIEKLARKVHADRFPEEYDFMGDSCAEASERGRGVNPMREEYIEKVNEKRRRLGVSMLSESGDRTGNDTMEQCVKDAERETRELLTRIDEIIFYKWDPLHLSDSNCSRDEYESYVPEVFRLALENKSYHPIADYLTNVATEIMSMAENSERDNEIALLIFSLAENELDKLRSSRSAWDEWYC